MHKRLWQTMTIAFILFVLFLAPVETIAREKILITMPDLDWALEINCPTFEVERGEFNPNGPTWELMAKDRNTGMIMSIFVEPAANDGDKSDCREYYWERLKSSPVNEEEVVFKDQGETALAEYMIRKYRGVKLDQKHLNIYMAKDGFWIDIHLSKVNYREADRAHFDKVLASTRIIEGYIQTAMDNFLYASYYYMRDDLGNAIVYYEKALQGHLGASPLDHDLWRVSVDNLAMAYGISGDLANSERVLLEGIKQDPTYPMFYYNIACTYAEMGDKSNAIANLRRAFEHRDNMIAGEKFPDPRKDSSFKLLLDDPAFVTVLTENER